MFSMFLPKETGFFDLFDQHAALIVKSTQTLLSIWTADQSIPLVVEKIKMIENEADQITHQTVELLHKTFITPIEREDIFRLISRMDDVIDNVEGAADCLILYKISTMFPLAKNMVRIFADCALELEIAVKGLRNIDNSAKIRDACVNINRLESDADFILRVALGRLFDEEKDTRALIKWKEIFENLEVAVDRCEDASNIIEGVILEYS